MFLQTKSRRYLNLKTQMRKTFSKKKLLQEQLNLVVWE